MANPTSNFGWQMPTNTDLVKDLPADFEVFGQAVDTSLMDLKGGTTGQILSKASNTDMDFTWIANDQGDITAVNVSSPITGGGTAGAVTVGIQDATTAQKGAVQLTDSISSTSTTTAATPNAVKTSYDLANAAIPKSLVDAKADLITATADNTPARLAVGNNGETLIADSSATTGLRYNPTQAAGKNALINGGFDIWQRGTSSTSSAGYFTADRWAQYMPTGTGTFSQETTNIASGQVYGLKWTSNSAGSTGNIYQPIETLNAVQYAGQTVTISGYLHGTVGKQVRIQLGTSTSDNVAWNGAYSFTVLTTVTLSATVTRFSTTTTIASNVRSLNVLVSSFSTFASTENWTLSGIQFELGSVATAFSRAGGTLAGEFLAASRYYYRVSSDSGYKTLGLGYASDAATLQIAVPLPSRMRVIPTSIDIAALANYYYEGTGAGSTPTSITLSGRSTVDVGQITFTKAASFTQGGGYSIMSNNTSAFIGFSSEL